MPISLGRIQFINVQPVYYALENNIVSHDFTLHYGTPAELNDAMKAGELAVSSCSCMEYARRWQDYTLARDLCIASNGPVMSVLLLSQCPLEELADQTILLSGQSHTSVILTRMLFKDYIQIPVRYQSGSVQKAINSDTPPKAVLAIGDEALSLRNSPLFPYCADLALIWKEWTSLPFVFALWIINRRQSATFTHDPTEAIRQSRDWGMAHLDVCIKSIANKALLTEAELPYYYTKALKFTLGEPEIAGLRLFYQKCVESAVLPSLPPISFFDV